MHVNRQKTQFEETEKVSKPHSDKAEKLELLDQKFKRIINSFKSVV